MTRTSRILRVLALTAAVLLLWCHGLDSAFFGHAQVTAPVPASLSDAGFLPTAPARPDEPAVSCCFGGAGSNLLSVTLAKLPQVAAPLLTALLALPLLLFVPRPAFARARPLAPHHASLVAQSVLIRI